MTKETVPDRLTRDFYQDERVARDFMKTRYLSKTGRARSALHKRAILSLINESEIKDKRVLDVGCGTGRFTELFTGTGAKLVAGADTSRSMLNIARKTGRASYIEANALYLPFNDNSFDLAICVDALNHLKSYEQALNDICRVSKKVVISVPNKHSIMALAYVYKFIKRLLLAVIRRPWHPEYRGAPVAYTRYFSADELERLLRNNDMAEIRVTGCLLFPFMPPLATAFFQRLDMLVSSVSRRYASDLIICGEKNYREKALP